MFVLGTVKVHFCCCAVLYVRYLFPGASSESYNHPENKREQKEMEKQKNPFEILGVCESSTAKEVDEAFKRLAKSSHPDVMMMMNANAKSSSSSSRSSFATTRNFQAISHARDECLAMIAERNMMYYSNNEFGGGRYDHHHHHHHQRMARNASAARYYYARARSPSHVSATSFGLVLAFPFVFGLSFLGSVMNSSSDGESVLGNSKYGVGEIGRPNGVLHPPENAWLKDDARSRTVSSPTFQKLVGMFGGLFGKSNNSDDSRSSSRDDASK